MSFIQREMVEGVGYELWDPHLAVDAEVGAGNLQSLSSIDMRNIGEFGTVYSQQVNDRTIEIWRTPDGRYGFRYKTPGWFKALRHTSEPNSGLVAFALAECFYQLPTDGESRSSTTLDKFGQTKLRFAPLRRVTDESGTFWGARVTLGRPAPPFIRFHAPTREFPLNRLSQAYLMSCFALAAQEQLVTYGKTEDETEDVSEGEAWKVFLQKHKRPKLIKYKWVEGKFPKLEVDELPPPPKSPPAILLQAPLIATIVGPQKILPVVARTNGRLALETQNSRIFSSYSFTEHGLGLNRTQEDLDRRYIDGVRWMPWDETHAIDLEQRAGFLAPFGPFDLQQTPDNDGNIATFMANGRRIDIWRDSDLSYGFRYTSPDFWKAFDHRKEPTSRLILFAVQELFAQSQVVGLDLNFAEASRIAVFARRPKLRFTPVDKIKDQTGEFMGAKVQLGRALSGSSNPTHIIFYGPEKEFSLRRIYRTLLNDSLKQSVREQVSSQMQLDVRTGGTHFEIWSRFLRQHKRPGYLRKTWVEGVDPSISVSEGEPPCVVPPPAILQRGEITRRLLGAQRWLREQSATNIQDALTSSNSGQLFLSSLVSPLG